ncbi:TetR/AcrR family transcriptional regulator [Saccharopolyspora hirsuta]|uniref:TetR/AcrR family transcriptional regulator n=1 Tax=Saccharopolyspora hirsuta TaxID=1837 RepID=A0A5M7BSQ4_SACHI|nr:TetR/AcrR family transcriptional regulator [Saccharopolyspora hirsuta]KAA5831188.1 TetR/AcrR family transcriptional regulator [Saccharopolyspora hirsuta]
MSGLRERKKRRTKQALIDAALRLFDAKGYDSTTVAEIAAAAEVSPATFFNYFATKDEVVFADDAIYGELLAQAFADRTADESPEDLLLRTIEQLSTAESWSFPLDHELTRVRARLIAEVPALRAGALLRNASLQQQLARGLREAYPDELDELHAAALTGALLGAIDAVMHAGLATPDSTSDVVRRAAEIALRGRSRHPRHS